jgi:hypothetical protein
MGVSMRFPVGGSVISAPSCIEPVHVPVQRSKKNQSAKNQRYSRVSVYLGRVLSARVQRVAKYAAIDVGVGA